MNYNVITLKREVMQMAKEQTLQMRIDSKLKAEADNLFSELGITTAGAINLFLKQALICKGLPFQVKLPMYDRSAPTEDKGFSSDR
jgi:DNA-damage-inducible protein J